MQGLVSLLPTTSASGGNVLVAKSHKLFPHYYLSPNTTTSSSTTTRTTHTRKQDGGSNDDCDDRGLSGGCAGPGRGGAGGREYCYADQVAAVNGDDWFALPKDDPMLDPMLDPVFTASISCSSSRSRNSNGSNSSRRSNKSARMRRKKRVSTEVVSVALRAGDLLLWDSRTVHCSSPGERGLPPVSAAPPPPPPRACASGPIKDEGARGEAGMGSRKYEHASSKGGDSGIRTTPLRTGAPLLRACTMVCMMPRTKVLAEAAAATNAANAAADATSAVSAAPASTAAPASSAAADASGVAAGEQLMEARRLCVDQGVTTPHWPTKASPLLEQYHQDVKGGVPKE